jgi:hypothetical protein
MKRVTRARPKVDRVACPGKNTQEKITCLHLPIPKSESLLLYAITTTLVAVY